MMTDYAGTEGSRELHTQRLEQEAVEYISANNRLRAVTMFDPELGIGSPEALEVELENIHHIAVRYHRPYAVVMVDLDDYDVYIAHYGRKAARLAHKLMAEHVRHSCRSADRLYRFGSGTPVLLILPETGLEGARVLADRVVHSFAERNIPNSKSEFAQLTLSVGIAACEAGQGQVKGAWGELLDDVQLYTQIARGQGGNRVAQHEDDPSDNDTA